jgi:hypothetical protein
MAMALSAQPFGWPKPVGRFLSQKKVGQASAVRSFLSKKEKVIRTFV